MWTIIWTQAGKDRDKPACYKRVRASEDMLEKLQLDLSACEDREVVFLKPMGCRGSDFKDEAGQGKVM